MNDPISIIIIADSYANALERNLPSVLAQRYEPGFEVIVVRETKKGETHDVLKPLLAKHENLSSTYLPDKPQYITDAEVAIMLGTKSAKNDQIIIIHPTFEVGSDGWLAEAAAVIDGTITVGKPHYHRKSSFLSRFRHRQKTMKLLGRWCKENDIKKRDVCLKKQDKTLFNIAYSKEAYIGDADLRYFIYRHTNP